MLFWKCLYPYFNFKWLFDVATEFKILLWHTYLWFYWKEKDVSLCGWLADEAAMDH